MLRAYYGVIHLEYSTVPADRKTDQLTLVQTRETRLTGYFTCTSAHPGDILAGAHPHTLFLPTLQHSGSSGTPAAARTPHRRGDTGSDTRTAAVAGGWHSSWARPCGSCTLAAGSDIVRALGRGASLSPCRSDSTWGYSMSEDSSLYRRGRTRDGNSSTPSPTIRCSMSSR